MKNLAKKIDYNKFRNAKSLSQVLVQIPDSYFEMILFCLLAFYCLSPVFIVALLNLGITFFNPEFLLLQVGYVSIIFTLLIRYKRFSEKSQEESEKKWISKNLPFLFLGAVVVWAILSTLFSSNMEISFFGDYYRKEGLLTIGAYAGIFTGMLSIHDEKLKLGIIQIFVCAATILGIVVILQYYGLPLKSEVFQLNINNDRAFILWAGIFHNINHYGYYLSLAVMATGGLFIFEIRKGWLLIYGLAYSLLTWVLVANNTFGSFLGVAAALVVTTGAFFYRKEKIKKSFLLLLVFFAITLTVNGIMGQVGKNVNTLTVDMKEIAQSSNEKASEENIDLAKTAGSGRWQLWVGALKIMEQKPLLGTGPDNMATSYADLGLQWDRPHNEYLQIGASFGIPALIFYLLALIFGYAYGFKHLKELSKSLVIAFSACTGYLFSALFGNTMYYTYPYFLIFLAIAFSRKPTEAIDENPHSELQI